MSYVLLLSATISHVHAMYVQTTRFNTHEAVTEKKNQCQDELISIKLQMLVMVIDISEIPKTVLEMILMYLLGNRTNALLLL